MTEAEIQFEEDFRLVFAISKKMKSISTQQIVNRVKQHSMSAARENQVVFKITSFSSSKTAIAKTLKYNSRKGNLDLFDNMDNSLKHAEDVESYKNFVDEVIGLNSGQHKTKRLTMNFVLSLSEGTPKREFEAGTRDFLSREFGSQPYLYTFHDDTEHYHAHVVSGLRNYQGDRVITSKEQLLNWRQSFADALREQGIEAEATPALSRGSVSQNTELRSKERVIERGETLKKKTVTTKSNTVKNSIDKRLDAWKRMHKYMHERGLDGAYELNKYISYTYHHEKRSLEQEL